MSTIILLFTLVAIVHFIIEFIVAPHIRQEVALDAYRLRQDARTAHRTIGPELQPGQYQVLRSECEALPHIIARMDLMTMLRMAKAMRKDRDLRHSIVQRVHQCRSIENPDARRLLNRNSHLGRRAFMANTLGWGLYLLPLALVSRFVRWLRRSLLRLMLTPEHVLDRIAPRSEIIS